MFTYFTDTDTDITPAVAAEYGYRLISMPYSIDAKTVHPYVDFDEFDAHGFYDMLRSGVLPTTSAISKECYLEYFEPEFAAGNDILYVHFSAAMTATFQSMDKALAVLKEKYPERRFYGIDTQGITIVSYLITRELGDRIKAGMTAEEAVAWAGKEVGNYSQYFFADDLKFFRRSGRVSGLAATMGTLIGIRPIIYMSAEGKMVSCGTVKGRVKAMEHLVGRVAELGEGIKDHRFVIGHTDAPELAQEVGAMLRERFGEDLPIEYVVANPTAGSHAGPNGVGVCFHAKNR